MQAQIVRGSFIARFDLDPVQLTVVTTRICEPSVGNFELVNYKRHLTMPFFLLNTLGIVMKPSKPHD